MIARDQPTIFPDDVIVRVSSVGDGTMTLKSLPKKPDEVWHNRQNFITKSGGDIENTALVYVTYDDGRSYEEYKLAETVDKKLSTNNDDTADGLATQQISLGLFLPLADCCAVVLYDPEHHALMVSHIGRHSVEIYGATKSVEFMKITFGTEPRDILAWLSPAVGGENYPIFARGHQSLKVLIAQDLQAAGVKVENIEISPVDTARNDNYYSHSEYQKGHQKNDGRHAVFALMQ